MAKLTRQLAKFLAYVLGRNPAEFGLSPDAEGFIPVKELLKALGEEEGWHHVRKRHLEEILITEAPAPFEMDESRIRATDRSRLEKPSPSEAPPKLLYTCIRKKAHAPVLNKGIFPAGHQRVILSSEKEMALRLGKRKDPAPVLLTVQTQLSEENGVVFYHAGGDLYQARFIPAGCFTAPPLPKKALEPKKAAKPKKQPQPVEVEYDPFDVAPKPERGRKKGSWKDDKKRLRRQKQKGWQE